MADDTARLEAALGGSYVLEREAGKGGMATVYRARDLKHARDVAIKVLRPELAASLGTERFLKEVEISARLSHPHIVPLFDSGEADGFLYFVMPFVEGESLRRLLLRRHRLELAESLDVTRQVASALGHAHRMGVLHRDIKPENILLDHGHAYVADFGVAKAISSAGGVNLTRTGHALGTPGYMSPEQAAGVRTLDVRTDVYGLACVCYEMLVGGTPGLWLTEEAVRVGRFLDAEPRHRERLDALPGRLEQVLARALALRATDRYPTVQAFSDALDTAVGERPHVAEADIQRILDRAAELDYQAPTQGNLLSIGAVEQVAAQVGIPPERVREAAEELGRRPASAPVPATPASSVPRVETEITGGPVLRVSREVPAGRDPAAYGRLLAEVRATLQIAGRAEAVGSGFTWTGTSMEVGMGRTVRVTVAPIGDMTHIAIEEPLGSMPGRVVAGIAGGFFGWVLGLPLGFAVNAPDLAPLFTTLLGAAGAYVSQRSVLVHTRSLRHQQLERLADRLAVLLAGPEPAALPEP